jgi:hypothetical protein
LDLCKDVQQQLTEQTAAEHAYFECHELLLLLLLRSLWVVDLTMHLRW